MLIITGCFLFSLYYFPYFATICTLFAPQTIHGNTCIYKAFRGSFVMICTPRHINIVK